MKDWELKPARDLGLPAGARHRSVYREGGLVETLLRAGWWTGVRLSMAVFHRLQISGREHLPAAPSYILAANHESHLDALVLGCAVPLRLRDRLFPLAAGDLFFEVPARAAFSALALNALPVWRRNCGKHGLADLRQRLVEEPCVYILFPEGTRTRDGRMGKFRAGIGMLVAETSVPVVPCFLDGPFRAFPPQRWLPRFSKIGLTIGAPQVFASTANNRAGWNEIAATVEVAVTELASGSRAGRAP